MRSIRVLPTLFCVALLPVIPGCDSGPTFSNVTGTVTLDGQPLSDAEISFLPADGQGRPDSTRIENGKFTLPCTVGNKKVTVTAFREIPGETAKGAAGEDIPVTEMYIPAKYNTETTLTAVVLDDDLNEFEFALKSE